ncbi:MAG: alkaline phosphatase PhoX [Myxococcota bacterium]
MIVTRRSFLGWGTTLSAGATVSFANLVGCAGRCNGDDEPDVSELVPDPGGILDLPEGFTYRIVQEKGDRMSDGKRARGRPDGMAAFAGPDGTTILMRNHELLVGAGGVSRVVLDEQYDVVSSNDVLNGTTRNCAGGPSPWGWLSCEETPRGGVWVCPIDLSEAMARDERVRIDGYGSFKHEAVAVDPGSLVAYLTEDDGDAHFFRFVPASLATPFEGQLQAMTVDGTPRFRTDAMTPGDAIEVAWVDVAPDEARATAESAGAAVVRRGEGVWWFDGTVYFTATSNGQVFELVPIDGDRGRLTLLTDAVNKPDNITVGPDGTLYVAEDNGCANFVRRIDPDGTVRPFAYNRLKPEDEFAGVCFSPRGDVMFVNLQGSGLTLIIEGPFPT